jgi:hypothetical protein
VIVASFEQTWLLIFRSQLEAMHAVNGNPLHIDGIQSYYDAGGQRNALLANYLFADWLAFMTTSILVRQDGADQHHCKGARVSQVLA